MHKNHCHFDKLPSNCYIPGPTGPTGPAGGATITVGSTTTTLPGTDATVTNVGTDENVILDFTIPAGEPGTTPNFSIGDVETGAPGSEAVVTITEVPNNL